MTISSREREQRLFDAVDKLAKYYAIRTSTQDISAVVDRVINSLNRVVPRGTAGNPAPADPGTIVVTDQTQETITEIFSKLFNSPIGAVPIETLATTLNNIFNGDLADLDTINFPIGNIVQVIGDTPQVVNFRNTLPTQDNQIPGLVRSYKNNIKNVSIFDNSNNCVPIVKLSSEERAALVDKKMYVVLITSPNLNISNRYAKPVSLFLNGVPAIEISKAVPYVEVEFEFPIPALDENNRLLSPSIYKAMLGGVQANPDTPLWSMQNANSSSNLTESNSNFTNLGMEMFLTPQTLLNRRYSGDASDIRANNVLDPTRPLLTIKQFSTAEVPSFAMYGYRSATLNMALMDRSRMPDFAPFFRADLRGTTRVKVEYGWHHPEGEELIRARRNNASPYVDLINGMRRIEKFQIRNSAFSFRENGIVDINLDLVTLGQSQLASELIIRNPNSDLAGAISRLESLQTSLSNYLARTNLTSEEGSSSSGAPSVEIRGTEVLYAASDAFRTGFSLSEEEQRNLSTLIESLSGEVRTGRGRRSSRTRVDRSAILTQVRDTLNSIWNGSNGTGGAASAVETEIRRDVQNQINDLRQYCLGRPATGDVVAWPEESEPIDPLVVPPENPYNRPEGLRGLLGGGGLEIPRVSEGARGNALPEYLRTGGAFGNGLHQYSVSLATLMANFVAQPLLQTGTYEEIQLIFYPFNENAAYASKMNIGNFEINLGMLTELLIEYRLANTSRSATMTLAEFWSFINTNFIDNPAATSYGLWDTNGSFYRPMPASRRTEIGRDNPDATTRYLTEPAYDETTLNGRIATLLANGVTPTGEFRPPQLRLFTECLPIKDNPDTNKNILKIHIYDQQASGIAGTGEILLAERNRALSLAGRPETDATTPLSEQWNSYRQRLIEAASSAGIIQPVPNTNRFVIRGGSRAIKDFIMNNMPYLIPGMQNSLIKGVSLSSLQDEAAATLNLVNSPRTAELISPNGEEPGNLPLQIIPVEMSMTTYGCPLIGFGTQYFVDLNTGTTADDIYNVNQISSEFEPGKYTTNIKFRPISGYTRYRNFLNEIREAIDRIDENREEENDAAGGATPSPTGGEDRGERAGERRPGGSRTRRTPRDGAAPRSRTPDTSGVGSRSASSGTPGIGDIVDLGAGVRARITATGYDIIR
jgi:hypothetical protein